MFDSSNETASSVSMPTFFGLSIPTHRNESDDAGAFTYFPYEPIIAAISIIFFRITVKLQRHHQKQSSSSSSSSSLSSPLEEHVLLRYLLAIILGMLAYTQQSYQHIVTAELSSYMISYVVLYATSQSTKQMVLPLRLVCVLIGAFVSVLVSHGIVLSFCNPMLQQLFLDYMVPNVMKQAFLYLFPIVELQKAYRIMEQFMVMEQQEFFHHMIHHLFFVTFHIQVGMGYLGIAFLRSEQSRRNQLIRLDVYDDEDEHEDDHHRLNGTTTNGKDVTSQKKQKLNTKKNNKERQMAEKSRIFQKGAAPFSTFPLSF